MKNSKNLKWGLAMAMAISALSLAGVGCNSGGALESEGVAFSGAGGPLLSREEADRVEMRTIQTVAKELAAKNKVPEYKVTLEQIKADPRIEKMGFEKNQIDSRLNMAVDADFESMPPLPNLRGFKKLDFNDKNAKALNFSIMKMPDPNPQGGPQTPTYVDFKTMYEGKKMELLQLKIIQTMPAPPAEKGKPTPPPQKQEQVVYYGPVMREEADKQIADAKKQGNLEVEIIKTWPASFYTNDKGRIALVVEGGFTNIHRATAPPIQVYEVDPKAMNELQSELSKNTAMRMPRPRAVIVAAAR